MREIVTVTGCQEHGKFMICVHEWMYAYTLDFHDYSQPDRTTILKSCLYTPSELCHNFFSYQQELFATPAELSRLLLTGGTTHAGDISKYRTDGGNIIVATPGRAEAMFKSVPELAGYCKDLDVLVLDEADRLLDMGFEASINILLSYLPKQRRTGLFSATQTKEVTGKPPIATPPFRTH